MHPTSESQKPVVLNPGKVELPISLLEARYRHIEYLQRGPFVYTKPDAGSPDIQILCSLRLEQSDLELLYRNAQGGIRLHLVREASGDLNITLVSLDRNGDLNVNPDPTSGLAPIVNTLSPCPHYCNVNEFSETSLNAWKSDGTYFWINPNVEQDGKIWYRRGPNGEKIFVDAPADAPPGTTV